MRMGLLHNLVLSSVSQGHAHDGLPLARPALSTSRGHVPSTTDSGFAVSLAVLEPRAHSDAEVKVRIRDAAGIPLTGAGVNGWFSVHPPGAPPLDRGQCVQRIARFTAGGLSTSPRSISTSITWWC